MESHVGGIASETGYGVAVDASGNVFLTGQTTSFGNGTLGDAFIVKDSKSDTQLWNKTWGGSKVDSDTSVATDSAGNAFMAGYTGSYGAGGNDGFVAKYAADGTQLWNRTWGSLDDEHFFFITADMTRNIFVTGDTDNITGNYGVLRVKYSGDGLQLWNTIWGFAAGDDKSLGVALDTNGNIYVTGWCVPPGSSYSDAVLIKFTSNMLVDYSSWWLVLVIMLIAIAVVVVLVIFQRKRKKRAPAETAKVV